MVTFAQITIVLAVLDIHILFEDLLDIDICTLVKLVLLFSFNCLFLHIALPIFTLLPLPIILRLLLLDLLHNYVVFDPISN